MIRCGDDLLQRNACWPARSAWQSSYSGAKEPSPATLTRTLPCGVSTSTQWRGPARGVPPHRCAGRGWMFRRKRTAHSASRFSGVAITRSSEPGRPFFISSGCSVASSAPAAKQAFHRVTRALEGWNRRYWLRSRIPWWLPWRRSVRRSMTRSTLACSRKSWSPAPYPILETRMGGMAPKSGSKRDDHGGAGRRGQFHSRAARINRLADQKRGGSGGGHGQHAVFRVHGAAADVHGRDKRCFSTPSR